MEKTYKPTTKEELKVIISELMEKHGNDVNLNCIDTSAITDMSSLFSNSRFRGDISEWNVANVKDMSIMFYGCPFNGDISKWDVSNVERMHYMFHAALKFDKDISKWNVSNVKTMCGMFCHAVNFKCNISEWNISPNVIVDGMFSDAPDFPIEFMPGLKNKKEFLVKNGRKCIIRPASIMDSLLIAESINQGIDNVQSLDVLNSKVRTDGTLYNYRNALIAEVDGKPVGCIVAYEGRDYRSMLSKTWPSLDLEKQTMDGEYHVDSLYVIPEFQHQSIANHLCEMARICAEMRYPFHKITTLVSSSNGSLVYYFVKNGFRYAGSRNLWGTNYFLMSKDYQQKLMPKSKEPIEFCVGSEKFKMIFVEGDGDHKPFYISETVVTNGLWDAVMKTNSGHNPNIPKTYIERDHAEIFLQRLAINTFCTFRLPSAAEWQWAAKGGVKSQGYIYAGSNDVEEVAWYRHNSAGQVHEVAKKKPNELGLYDMSGNVWEMTTSLRSESKYQNFEVHTDPTIGSYSSMENPQAAIYCGGAFYDSANACSVDKVGLDEIQWDSHSLGFRIVCDLNKGV